MNSIFMAFFLTTIAGFSTMLGTIPIFIKLKNESKIIAGSLSFAAGVMICVSVIDLIPESISMLENNYSGILTIVLVFLFMLVGILLSSLIENKLYFSDNDVSLYKVGIISMIAIILHNIPEDCSCYASH